MKVTEFSIRALRWRKEHRDMKRAGFREFEDWQIMRGDDTRKVITEARVSQDGKTVFYRVGEP